MGQKGGGSSEAVAVSRCPPCCRVTRDSVAEPTVTESCSQVAGAAGEAWAWLEWLCLRGSAGWPGAVSSPQRQVRVGGVGAPWRYELRATQ